MNKKYCFNQTNNMNKIKFNNELIDFIKKSTCSFTCVEEIKKTLNNNGYTELFESNIKDISANKFYITRNDASIIAVEIPQNKSDSFMIVTTHTDTPSLLLKPNCAYTKEKYLKLNVMPYGGLLNFGWIDHPLSLAGRVIVKDKNKLISKIIDFKKPILIIPSVAIHQKSDSNTNLKLNEQIDLQPIIGISKNVKEFNKLLEREVDGKIIDYDLYTYNIEKSKLIGINNELLVSPRIDNLTSVYSGLMSFIESNSSTIKVFCGFDNEEIGSLTEEGADSNFLLNILKKISAKLDFDLSSSLQKSFIINSDNTHAVHPNHTEYADETGKCYLNEGIAIVREAGTSTNSLSSSIIKTICNKNKIKYQDSTARSDISGGSTLSGINIRHVSVLSVDIGIPQLSMHSSIETCGINDIYELYKLIYYFYKTKIIKNEKCVDIK